ncbi:DUF914-domain-containing protein [Xylariaceae sp. FL0255]|nr:DUF914-domain-containing protein [Xylariaceae sp. FL0255]
MADYYPSSKPGDESTSPEHTVEVSASNGIGYGNNHVATSADNADEAAAQGLYELESADVHWYSYLKTTDFWIVLVIGQVLALALTAQNTFTTLISDAGGVSIPAFQTFFNYVLMSAVYIPLTLYYYGPKKLGKILLRDGWKYFILSFCDVEGNYFTVLAYDYTNILSAQLINFWAIVIVVVLSFLILKVRYKIFQVIGILICVGGTGILLASDHIQGLNGGPGVNLLKGDLFALLGATFYGCSNTFEEWYVSKRPSYEVLAFMGFWGVIINGTQAAIFDRHTLETGDFTPKVIGYIVGYTLALFLFYSLVPFLLRIASAAFFNISLLTTNFWGTIVGIRVFHDHIYFLYPIAFVLIIIGQLLYFLAGSILGDSKKPWLGADQEDGVAGYGTAKLKAINAARRKNQMAAENAAAQRETENGLVTEV